MFNQEKKIKIPKEFTLFGHKYNVILTNNLFETDGCYGNADEDLKIIKIQDVGTAIRTHEENGKQIETPILITEQTVVETFFHEVTHIILDATGDDELSENERFVTVAGKAWLEIYLSSIYEKDCNNKEEIYPEI